MSVLTCSKSHVWIISTLHHLALISHRPVSTTSAINRGLRATKSANASRPSSRGSREDRPRARETSSRYEKTPSSDRKPRPSSSTFIEAPAGRYAGRNGRRDGPTAPLKLNASWEDRKRARSLADPERASLRVKKFTSEGERPGRPGFESNPATRYPSKYDREQRVRDGARTARAFNSGESDADDRLQRGRGKANFGGNRASDMAGRRFGAQEYEDRSQTAYMRDERLASPPQRKAYGDDAPRYFNEYQSAQRQSSFAQRQSQPRARRDADRDISGDSRRSRTDVEDAFQERGIKQSHLRSSSHPEVQSDRRSSRIDSSYASSPRQRPEYGQSSSDAIRGEEEDDSGMPIAIPHTTASSAFLYGTNTVLAALRSQRRKIYKIYLQHRPTRFVSDPTYDTKATTATSASAISHRQEILKLAKASHIPVQSPSSLHLLDAMAENRPHNGIVLEASKLPYPPVLGLGKPIHSSDESYIPITLAAKESAEDAAINGRPTSIPFTSSASAAPSDVKTHPLVVMTDGILDPGNLGGILRTAHFYNLPAVAIATNTCANVHSPVVAKASSGACEALRMLSLPKPAEFVRTCVENGWGVYGAVPPSSSSSAPSAIKEDTSKAKPTLTTSDLISQSPLRDHPVLLILGAEGEGLRPNLRDRCKGFVTIQGGVTSRSTDSDVDVGLDSLNVGTAAAVLVEAFVRGAEIANVAAVQEAKKGNLF